MEGRKKEKEKRDRVEGREYEKKEGRGGGWREGRKGNRGKKVAKKDYSLFM